MKLDSAKRVVSGTFGQVWFDNELVTEVYKFQAKINYNKEDVPLCGNMGVDKKVTSFNGTGTVGMYKITSRMAKMIGEYIRNGRDIRFTIISTINDPDSFGAERIAIKNVSFDDLTLADWEAKTIGKIEAPFTYTDYEYLDIIDPNGDF